MAEDIARIPLGYRVEVYWRASMALTRGGDGATSQTDAVAILSRIRDRDPSVRLRNAAAAALYLAGGDGRAREDVTSATDAEEFDGAS